MNRLKYLLAAFVEIKQPPLYLSFLFFIVFYSNVYSQKIDITKIIGNYDGRMVE